MATVVDALLITLGIDTKGVDKGMDAVRGKITGGLKNIVSAMAAPVMTALAGFSVATLTSAYVGQAQGLKQLSDSLGMSMEDLQGWQYAAEAAGVEAEKVGNFFRDMNGYIVKATTFDSGPLKDISKKLGISLKDAQGNVRDTMDVVLDLSDAFQKVDSQKAVAFGMQMRLDPGMIQLLQKGRGEIEGLIRAQKELGGYTKEDAEIVAKAQFSFMAFGRAIKAAAMPVARVLVPAMTKATTKLNDVVAVLRRHKPFVKAALVGIAAIITGMLIPASVKLAAAWIMNPMTWIIGLITAAVAVLVIAIDDLITYMDGGESEFADFWAIFGTGKEIAEALGRAWEELKAIGSALFEGLTAGVRQFFQNFSGVFSGLAQVVTGVLQVIKGLFAADFSSIVEGIGNVFTGVSKTILGIFSGIVKSVSDAFWGVVNAVGGWFTDMLASIPGLGWALEKMGVVGGEETKTTALVPTTADSGNLASQASYATARQEINATSNVRTGPITINTDATDAQGIARDLGNEVSRFQWGKMPFSSQTGVLQK